MPPMSMAAIEATASALAAALGLERGVKPKPIPWPYLNCRVLPGLGVHVTPVEAWEINGDEGATEFSGALGAPIEILLREDVYDALEQRGPASYRAAATMAHELSHAALHVNYMRRRQQHAPGTGGAQLLRRVERRSLAAYEDPEWQAWALAGCLYAPRALLVACAHWSERDLSQALGISEQFLRAQVRRLRLTVPKPCYTYGGARR